MNRKEFIDKAIYCGAGLTAGRLKNFGIMAFKTGKGDISYEDNAGISADLVIAGGGLGGCAAAIAALRNDLKVIMTEETGWIGGQISQQGVPPDEHQWIEAHGSTKLYRHFRNSIRQYYFRNYPLTKQALEQKYFNPGGGSVSRLCCEPSVAVSVLHEMLAPFTSSGKLILLNEYKVVEAEVNGETIKTLRAINLRSGNSIILSGQWFIDATETGELLPLTGTEFVTGTESNRETGELHAPEKADPGNQQAFTVCFAMDYIPGTDNTIEKPEEYSYWKEFIPDLSPPWSGKLLDLAYSNPKTLEYKRLGFHPEGIRTGDLLNLWNYRRIISKNNFLPGTFPGDITVVNWPQNDYMEGNLVGVSQEEANNHVRRAAQLSLSLLYWLQTEAPRDDGGTGWPGLRLRKDIMGTEDGLAKYPYIRESRRIKAIFTILEQHVGAENLTLVTGRKNNNKAADFPDSTGTGYYHIDLHPSSMGNNYIDFASLPFQIPLGALLPVRMRNIIPACKNIGTTHITNGCYRLHPVEWSIGEAAGMLIVFSKTKKVSPVSIHQQKDLLCLFQNFIRSQGIETHWPEL
jgi:hypothetical protein